jgi:hypothetical protein
MKGSTMSDEKIATGAKAAWQAQPSEVPTMSYLRLRALDHKQYGRNRSLLEYGAAAVGLAVAAWVVVVNDSMLLRVGLAALAAGALYWLHQWRRQRLTWTETTEASGEDALSFYRRELARVRDAHRALRMTHIVASVPGALLLSVWLLREAGATFSERWWQAAVVCAAVVAWIGSMVWHEAEKANEYQRELEALEHTAD